MVLQHLTVYSESGEYPELHKVMNDQEGGFSHRIRRQIAPIHIAAYYLTPKTRALCVDSLHQNEEHLPKSSTFSPSIIPVHLKKPKLSVPNFVTTSCNKDPSNAIVLAGNTKTSQFYFGFRRFYAPSVLQSFVSISSTLHAIQSQANEPFLFRISSTRRVAIKTKSTN